MTTHFRAVPVLRAAASGLRPILRACPAGSCRRESFSAPRPVCARPVTSRSAGQARVRLPPVRSRLFSPQPARRISARGLLPFMLPRPGSGRLRPPPFVHPCVPAPRLIPPRCGLSWLPCTSLQSHSSALGSGGRPPLHAVALSLRGQRARTQVFSLCARAPVQAVCARPLLCIHAYPRPGSSPCARASVSPAPSSGPRPQPRTPPSVPRRLFFRPPHLRACRRAAYAPSPPDFLSAPGPLSYAPSSACPKRAVLYSGRAAAPLSAVFSPQKGRSGVLTVV